MATFAGIPLDQESGLLILRQIVRDRAMECDVEFHKKVWGHPLLNSGDMHIHKGR